MEGNSDRQFDPSLTASEVLAPPAPPAPGSGAPPAAPGSGAPPPAPPPSPSAAGADAPPTREWPADPGTRAARGPAPPGTPAPPAGGATAAAPPDGTRRRTHARLIVEWTAVLVLALVLALGVRAYVAQMFYIPSGSMLPTLQVGDRIIVNKLSYRIHGVGRGDIVVFRRPPLEQADYSDLVKRVIGLPGDTISLADGKVYIDGKPLAEPWLPTPAPVTMPSPHTEAFSLNQPFTVPPGEYYVMGDNRANSEDSRYFGPIPQSLIVGKLAFVAWPLTDTTGILVLSVVAAVVIVLLVLELREPRTTRASPASEGTW